MTDTTYTSVKLAGVAFVKIDFAALADRRLVASKAAAGYKPVRKDVLISVINADDHSKILYVNDEGLKLLQEEHIRYSITSRDATPPAQAQPVLTATIWRA